MPIENPMVNDLLWTHKEQEPKVLGDCLGCQEDITEGDEVYEFQDVHGETVWVHQDGDCCMNYVADMSVCKTAGE
jgi:hypothetical protein